MSSHIPHNIFVQRLIECYCFFLKQSQPRLQLSHYASPSAISLSLSAYHLSYPFSNILVYLILFLFSPLLNNPSSSLLFSPCPAIHASRFHPLMPLPTRTTSYSTGIHSSSFSRATNCVSTEASGFARSIEEVICPKHRERPLRAPAPSEVRGCKTDFWERYPGTNPLFSSACNL